MMVRLVVAHDLALQRTRPAAAVSGSIGGCSRRAGPLSLVVRRRASVCSAQPPSV